MKQKNETNVFEALDNKVESFSKSLDKSLDFLEKKITDFDEEKFTEKISDFFKKVAKAIEKIFIRVGKIIGNVISKSFSHENRGITLLLIFILVILLIIAIVATIINT